MAGRFGVMGVSVGRSTVLMGYDHVSWGKSIVRIVSSQRSMDEKGFPGGNRKPERGKL